MAARMEAQALLARLVGFPSVVGRSNGDIIGFVADWLTGHGVTPTLIDGPEGDRQNLFATIGPADRPGYVLSAHLDVVPAEEPGWQGDPFTLRRDGDRLIGRGTSDMKGFVAALLARVPDWVAMAPEVPLHIALSYDEEAGCRGVPHLIARLPDLCAPPLGCLVGEPTGLHPVLRHKGKAGLRVTARGVSGHSARPDMGQNAIHALVPVLQATAGLQADLARAGLRDAAFTPAHSTVQIGVIAGGAALNIIPDQASALIEARTIAAEDPLDVLAPVFDAAARDPDLSVEVISRYPGLAIDADHRVVHRAMAASGRAPHPSVAFGTEAGLFQQAGVPTVVCGPGDMARAHRPEEYLRVPELAEAGTLLDRFVTGTQAPSPA